MREEKVCKDELLDLCVAAATRRGDCGVELDFLREYCGRRDGSEKAVDFCDAEEGWDSAMRRQRRDGGMRRGGLWEV